MKAQVLLDSRATDGEVAAVRRAFEGVGLEADVSASYEARGARDIPWAIIIAAPAALFLAEFAKAAGKEVGQAAGKAVVAGVAMGGRRLHELVTRLYEARLTSASPPGSVVLIDDESGTWIMLANGLPEEAARLLIEIPIVETPSGQLVWDFDSSTWRDMLDVERRTPPESTSP